MTQAKASPEIGKSIQVGNIKTNYHEAGSGAPVILIHGSGPGVSAWANWQFAIPYLAERLHVLAYDQIGFGYTDPAPNPHYSLQLCFDIFAYDPGKFPTDQLAEMRYQASIQPGAQEAFSSMFPEPRQEQVDALAAYEDRISEIQNQTLIIHGREDRVIPLETSLKLIN